MSGENIKTENIGLVLTNDEYTLFKNWWRIQNGIGEGTDTSPLSNAQIIDAEFGKVDNKFTKVDNKFTEISGNFDDVWNKFLDYYTKTEVDQKIAEAASAALRLKIVEELPDVPAPGETNFIYLVPKQDAAEKNIYEEYVWALIDTETGEKGWELIGTTEVDLTNYATLDDIANFVDRETVEFIVNENLETKQDIPAIGEDDFRFIIPAPISSESTLRTTLSSLSAEFVEVMIALAAESPNNTAQYMDNFGEVWKFEATSKDSANIVLIVGDIKYTANILIVYLEAGGSYVSVGEIIVDELSTSSGVDEDTVRAIVDESIETKQDIPLIPDLNVPLELPKQIFSKEDLAYDIRRFDSEFFAALVGDLESGTNYYTDNFGNAWSIEPTPVSEEWEHLSANVYVVVGDKKYLAKSAIETDTETGGEKVVVNAITTTSLVDQNYVNENLKTKQSFPLIPNLNVPLEINKQIFSTEDLRDDLLGLDDVLLTDLIGDTADTKYYIDNFGNAWSIEPTPDKYPVEYGVPSANVSIIVGDKKYLSSYEIWTDTETGAPIVTVGDVIVIKFVDENALSTKQDIPTFGKDNLSLIIPAPVFSLDTFGMDLESLDVELVRTMITIAAESPNKTVQYMDNFGEVWYFESTAENSAKVAFIISDTKYTATVEVSVDAETGDPKIIAENFNENLKTKQDIPTFGEDNFRFIITDPVFSEYILKRTLEEDVEVELVGAAIALAIESPNNAIQCIDNFGEVWYFESTVEDYADVVLIVGDIKYTTSVTIEYDTDTETGGAWVVVGDITVDRLSTGGGSADLDYATEDDVYKAMGIINLDNEDIEDTTFILSDTDIVDERRNMAILGEEEE